MSIRFLKVKIKSLAAEAHIIRTEERRARGTLRDELHNHRVITVRQEQRATLLAYGFLRGRTLAQIEPHSLPPSLRAQPDWKRVETMVKKYGSKEQRESLDAWRKPAQAIAA